MQFTQATRLTDGLPLFATDAGAGSGSSSSASTAGDALRAQAREIVRRLDSRAPSRMSIEAGAWTFCYLVEDGVVFLAAADRGYPRKLAHAYLTEVHRAFRDEVAATAAAGGGGAGGGAADWREVVATTSKPYAFLRFERQLHRLRREYADPSSRSNAARLADDLQDIQHIMRKSIDEVLDRGEKLESAFSLATVGAGSGALSRFGWCERLQFCVTKSHCHVPPLFSAFLADVSRLSSKMVADSKAFKWGAKRLNLMDRWRQALPFAGAIALLLTLLWWRFG